MRIKVPYFKLSYDRDKIKNEGVEKMQIINKYKNQITAVSFVLIVLGFIFGKMEETGLRNYSLITATLIASIPIGMKAYQSLRMKAFSIELLVIIAVVGA
ncbi:MAG TPA: hypothetical protein DHM90_03255, partial [Clostridiaceae bacterium]|nr:hypothetical protein [Clostridiaceae bacterium]